MYIHTNRRSKMSSNTNMSLLFVVALIIGSSALASKQFSKESPVIKPLNFKGSNVLESLQIEGQPRISHLGNVGNKVFFNGDNYTSWHGAFDQCRTVGMKMATLNSTAENDFVASHLSKGPFWFGARDIGRKEMYVWSESYGSPSPNDSPLGDFIRFYHAVEEGPMALVMHGAFGPYLVGMHSHNTAAKPLCQITTSK